MANNALGKEASDYIPVFKDLGIEVYKSDGAPTANGPKTGALVVDTTNGQLYINAGTVASATWNSLGAIAASEITLAEGNVLIGNASGVSTALDASAGGNILVGNDTTMTAVDASGDAQILVGDGTTLASVAVSGDVTIDNTGAVTIAAGAVTNSMVEDSDGTGSLEVPKSAVVLYDFAVDGGTAGTIALTGAPTIPDNAVVWVDSYHVETTCTSATDAATIALQLPTDGALTTAIAISDGSNPWDAGAFVGVQGGLATPLPKKTTAARVPSLLVAGGENLTAGKIVFHLSYWVSS